MFAELILAFILGGSTGAYLMWKFKPIAPPLPIPKVQIAYEPSPIVEIPDIRAPEGEKFDVDLI